MDNNGQNFVIIYKIGIQNGDKCLVKRNRKEMNLYILAFFFNIYGKIIFFNSKIFLIQNLCIHLEKNCFILELLRFHLYIFDCKVGKMKLDENN